MDLLINWRNRLVLAALCGQCALAFATPAPVPAGSAAGDLPSMAPAPAPAQARATATPANAADDAELEAARGGTSTTIVDNRLAGQVSGNTVNNVQTGWNVINGGAFSNMTGIPIVVQNSGANVLIQNATVIQLQMQ